MPFKCAEVDMMSILNKCRGDTGVPGGVECVCCLDRGDGLMGVRISPLIRLRTLGTWQLFVCQPALLMKLLGKNAVGNDNCFVFPDYFRIKEYSWFFILIPYP